jgi:hypothetical protein
MTINSQKFDQFPLDTAASEDAERVRVSFEQREGHRRRYAGAAKELLADLKIAGYDVSTMAELRPRDVDGKAAVPVLRAWLPRITYMPLRKEHHRDPW